MEIYANFELNDILTMEIKMQGESTMKFYVQMIYRNTRHMFDIIYKIFPIH